MGWQLRLKLTPDTVPASGAGLTANIRNAFALRAGMLIVDSIKNVLGHDALYKLSAPYEKRKPSLPKFRRYSGKSSGQPIILSGDLYEGLNYRLTGNTLIIDVDPSHGMDGGFDVAEHWEQVTHYLELGYDAVEHLLPDILEDVVFTEMNL